MPRVIPEFPEIIPEEMENPENFDDLENIKIETMKFVWNSLSVGKDNNENLKFSVEFWDKPIVFLSWNKNFKAVTNWMRRHMDAYPETQDGFLVKFIDNRYAWYKVEKCGENEWGEIIGGKNYKILPFRFKINVNKKNKNNLKK